MAAELLDQRILGALRFVDVTTGLPIRDGLSVNIPSLRLIRNHSNLYVVAGAPGLDAHLPVFDQPPAAPALNSLNFTGTVGHPGGDYLTRQFTVHLPRDPDPSNAGKAESLFKPIDIQLFPTPSVATAPNWSVIRATIRKGNANGPRLGNVLLRILAASDDKKLTMGLSDDRGEALVPVIGIAITTWGDNNAPNAPVVVTEIDAKVEAIYDPAFDPAANPARVPDPDDLETRRNSLNPKQVSVKLAAGREQIILVILP